MKHNNGYKFKFSKRNKKHQLGLDFYNLLLFQRISILVKVPLLILMNIRNLKKQEDHIHKNLEKYIHDYVEHVNGHIPLHIKQFERKYKYSTLKYFHAKLGVIVRS